MMTRQALLFAVLAVSAAAGCDDGGDGGGGSADVKARKLITRSLAPTDPTNLLVDPFIGGESGQYGQFYAYYPTVGGDVTMTRTFESQSPIGGALSIEEVRDLQPVTGATAIDIAAMFLGGGGSFHASLWLSLGDAKANPADFESSAVSVQLFAADGSGKATLVAGSPVTYGTRTWVRFQTAADVALPVGGWFQIELRDLTKTLQLAAPEVTSSELTGSGSAQAAALVALSEPDRVALSGAMAVARQHRERVRRRRRELTVR